MSLLHHQNKFGEIYIYLTCSLDSLLDSLWCNPTFLQIFFFFLQWMQSLGPEASWQDVCVLWDLHKHNILLFFLHFTFMHLADAFIQSDLQCIQAIHFFLSVCTTKYVQQYNKTVIENRTRGDRSWYDCMKTQLLECRSCHALWCKVTQELRQNQLLAHTQCHSFCHSPAAIGQGKEIECTWGYQMSPVHHTQCLKCIVWKSAAFSVLSTWCIIISNSMSYSKKVKVWHLVNQYNLIQFSI